MSKRAHLLILLAAISLTVAILLIAITTTQPLISLPEGKDPANQAGSIHITLADQASEPESDTPAQPADEPAAEPEPVSVPVSVDKISKPAEKAVARQSEKKATPAQPTKKQLRAGASPQTDSYLARLVRHLSAYRDYPRRARRLGLQGTPVVVFEFDRAGRLLNYRLLDGSSHRILDDAALKMLKQASPFPPVPDGMTSETFRFQLPVAFQLR